jgi:hypothetical protein
MFLWTLPSFTTYVDVNSRGFLGFYPSHAVRILVLDRRRQRFGASVLHGCSNPIEVNF